ncbi:hypothetical protein L204_106447 [Cryptococcus depauperatus]|nr:hypothetical protein L204_06166 [Cryptococcus depauperatus CBS 7855]
MTDFSKASERPGTGKSEYPSTANSTTSTGKQQPPPEDFDLSPSAMQSQDDAAPKSGSNQQTSHLAFSKWAEGEEKRCHYRIGQVLDHYSYWKTGEGSRDLDAAKNVDMYGKEMMGLVTRLNALSNGLQTTLNPKPNLEDMDIFREYTSYSTNPEGDIRGDNHRMMMGWLASLGG